MRGLWGLHPAREHKHRCVVVVQSVTEWAVRHAPQRCARGRTSVSLGPWGMPPHQADAAQSAGRRASQPDSQEEELGTGGADGAGGFTPAVRPLGQLSGLA